MLRLCTNRLGSAGGTVGLNPLGRVPRLLSSSLPSLRFSSSSSFSSFPSALSAPRSVTSSSCPLILGTRPPTASFSSPFGSPSSHIRFRRHNSTSSSSEKSAASEGSTSTSAPSSSATSAASLGGASSAAAQEAARKRAAEAVMQEYAALFRPGPQAPKEEFTARVLGAPFDVAFRGTVGVAVAVLLILVTFGVAAKISDAWDVYQLTRKLLDENTPPSPKDCFGREEDVRKMESRLGERPEFIYFVGGSPRSGLTTVVNRVLNDYAGNSYVINLRESSPMTGIEDVTHSLNKSLGFLEILPSFQSLKHHFSGWEIKGVLIPATEAQRIEALKSTLDKLTKALKFIRFLSRLKSSRTRENTYPIIAFDHFKEIMNTPDCKQTLNVLLKWALYITHEAHLAHVILVSSDPRVAYALTNDELLSGRIISVYIDSIAKESALKYLRKRLARSRYPREITEEEGEKIFSEIGSAFLDLNRVEAHLSSAPHVSVDQALDIMHRTTIAHIVGALGAEGRSWTPTQLWRTIKMLAESETGELDYFQLKTQVFHGNERVLHELFDAGILLYRVFPFRPNGSQMTPVVAAYTPFVMFCCKQLAQDSRLNAIMNRHMADEEAAASSLAGRLSSAMMLVS